MERKLITDLQESYGIDGRHFTPVTGGWLNKKWKITDSRGTWLVKQYSYERFSQNQLLQIEKALQRQMILQKGGIPCPRILPYKGQAIRHLDDETAYMVMTFCSGKIETPATVTPKQMAGLGSVCGRLHDAFSQLPEQEVKGFPISGEEMMDSLWRHFNWCMEGISADMPEDYKDAVKAQAAILQGLTAGFFDRLPKGIGHEDFSPDNILFHTEGVSAVLDFDRNQYGFQWHDVGRAILSLALWNDRLDVEKAEAFRKGCAAYMPLTKQDMADALRLTWCVEVPWWIKPDVFTHGNAKISRFRDEMVWLTKHWFDLESYWQ